jgi:isopentenyl diphosphate isomerase/L-lactate dehydrogenase-like FMN-dependent dehydrogenase
MSDSNKWSTYKPKVYRGRKGPQPLGSVVFEDIEEKAKEILKEYEGAFQYAYGSAGVDHTAKNNRRALEKFAIIPRMLVASGEPSLETTIFGVKFSAPVLIAPIGVQSIFHPEAEFATARAAKKLGIPMILSTVASRSIEEVAEANGNGHRWFQLYWPRTNDVILSLLKRARENGYSALVVTLDTMTIGWRPSDLQTSYLPFAHGFGCQIGLSDPTFMAKFGFQPIHGEHPEFPYLPAKMDQLIVGGDEKTKRDSFLGIEWVGETVSGKFRSWEDLRFLRENWKGPLVLKGIQCAQDAEKALDHGADGIVVSNHGGRQVDGAIPSLYGLVNVMKSVKVREAQESGKFTILFDSGIRTGSDIIKALALGAQAVLLGRPWVYGLVVGGQAGVEQVLEHTIADLDTNLSLAGYKSLADIQGKGENVIMKLDF